MLRLPSFLPPFVQFEHAKFFMVTQILVEKESFTLDAEVDARPYSQQERGQYSQKGMIMMLKMMRVKFL